MAAAKKEKSTNINAVDRALNILELLYYEARPMGVNEIAAKLGDYQSTVHRCVNTLKDRGYIYQDEISSKYGLDFKVYMLGKGVEKGSTLIGIARPYARDIAQEFRETVNVAVRYTPGSLDYQAVTILQEKGDNRNLSISETMGQAYDCYTSAVGKVLLAFSEDYNEDRVRTGEYKSFTSTSITDGNAMVDEMNRIRAQRYAVDNEEVVNGLYCVACPVLNRKGRAVLAMSVSGYKGHILELGVDNIVKRLTEACNEMSAKVL